MNQRRQGPLIKRLMERYQADPTFRASYSRDPSRVLGSLGLTVDPTRIESLAQEKTAEEGRPAFDIIQKAQQTPIANTRFHGWRQRQIKRIQGFYHASVFQWIVHAPMVFELSRGCSGRCAFCCFDPPNLSGVFSLGGATNRRLWRDILQISAQLVGPLLGQAGACYYATEPFDNPDYEELVADFREITGSWPQLTTVKCLDDPGRVRQYMSRIGPEAVRAGKVRFSITSLKMLREVHDRYSPEELEHVELLLNNPESSWKYSPAGRARKFRERMEERGRVAESKYYMPGPTACVTGFVVNLVDREIRLVSTCTPNEEHPCGYILFDTVVFNTADQYREALEKLIDRNMPDFPPADWVLSFSDGFRVAMTANACEWSTNFLTRRVSGDRSFIKMCQKIAEGRYTWGEISDTFDDAWITELYLKPKLTLLMDLGLLREPPRGNLMSRGHRKD